MEKDSRKGAGLQDNAPLSLGALIHELSFAKTLPGGQVIDLSAPIRRQSRLDDHPLAPRASTPPVPLRRLPPARGREPCPAAATGCVQKNDGPTQAAHAGSPLLDLAG